MSVSAIKSFFARANEKRERVAQRIKIMKTIPEEPVKKIDQEKLDEAYYLLKNWNTLVICDDNDLLYYYNLFDQDAYEYILSKRDDFSLEVKCLLWPEEYNSVFYYGKDLPLKVKELTEEMYNELLLQKARIVNKKVEEYVSNLEITPRTSGPVDEKADDLKADLVEYEKQLEDLKKSLSNPAKGSGTRYVPPALRKQMLESSPEVTRMETIIQNTKNEIQKLEVKIIELNNAWEQEQRYKLKQQYKSEVEMSML